MWIFFPALQFSQTLSHLDTAQQQISANLTSHGEMVKQVTFLLNYNPHRGSFVFGCVSLWFCVSDFSKSNEIFMKFFYVVNAWPKEEVVKY